MKIIIDISQALVVWAASKRIHVEARAVHDMIVEFFVQANYKEFRGMTERQWIALEEHIQKNILVSIDDDVPKDQDPATPPARLGWSAQAYCTVMREPMSGEEFFLVRSIDPLRAGSSMIGRMLLTGRKTFEFSRVAKVTITEIEG